VDKKKYRRWEVHRRRGVDLLPGDAVKSRPVKVWVKPLRIGQVDSMVSR